MVQATEQTIQIRSFCHALRTPGREPSLRAVRLGQAQIALLDAAKALERELEAAFGEAAALRVTAPLETGLGASLDRIDMALARKG